MGDGRPTQPKLSLNDAKINIINACDLFKLPLRASRPDHIVIILRGLPGSFTTFVKISYYLSSNEKYYFQQS